MCVTMHVRVMVYVTRCVSLHTHAYINVYIYGFIHMCVCLHTCVYTHICVGHPCMCVHINTNSNIFVHVNKHCKHTYMYSHILVYLRIRDFLKLCTYLYTIYTYLFYNIHIYTTGIWHTLVTAEHTMHIPLISHIVICCIYGIICNNRHVYITHCTHIPGSVYMYI